MSKLSDTEKELAKLNKQIENTKNKMAELAELYNNTGDADAYESYNRAADKLNKKLEQQKSLFNEVNKLKLDKLNNELGHIISQTEKLGSGFDKYISRLKAAANTAQHAFNNTNKTTVNEADFNRAIKLIAEYEAQLSKVKDKLNGFRNAEQFRPTGMSDEQMRLDALERAANKRKDIVKQLNDTIFKTETLSNKSMDEASKIELYNQALQKLEVNSKEYLQVLAMRNAAENKIADEAARAAEKEAAAQARATQQAKDRIITTLGMVKSFANGINSAVNKVISIIRTGISLINKIISTTGAIINKITTGIKSIISLFGGLSNRVRSTDGSGLKLNGTFNLIKGSATELRSKILLLKGALSTLFNNSMVAGATKLMSSVMSLDVIIGDDLTKSTIEWANSMQDAFGVDARGLISDLQEVTGVLKGLGMNNQDISVMGPNLLSISRYLAMMGLAGGDAEMAMSKITSGLKGMTQSIDDLGLSVRESEMNDFLKKLKQQCGELANIGTKYANLNEEARIYIRSASILQQFLTNFGTFNSDLSEYAFNVAAFTRTLNSVTGRISILKQAWSGFLSTVGAGLMKVAAVVAGYIIPVLRMATAAVERFFAWLSALTGINFNVSLGSDLNSLENIEDSSGGVKETTDGVADLNDELEKVDKNAKKAKGSLQSFDRVNNVTSSSGSSSSSGSGTDAFDYAKVLGGFKKLIDPLNEEYDNFLDSLKEKNEKWLNQFKNWIIRKCKEITGRIDFDLEFDWDKIKKSLVNIKDNVLSLIKSWGTFFIEIGLKIADDANIGKIITKFLEFASAVTDLAVAFSDVLIPVLRNFYDEVLSPIVKLVGEKIVEAFDKAIEKVKEWTKYLKDNKPELIEEWTEKIKHFFNVVTGKESANPEDGAIGTVLEILNKVGKVIKALIPIVSELASALGVFLKEEFLPWLNEKLGELAKWLSENKDAIVKFLKDIAGFVWDSFKVFVDLVSKLVDFCVKNPTAVKVFLAGLVAVKIASWATSSAAGIGQLVFQLQLLSKLGGITKALGGIGTAAATTSTELATIGAASGTAAKTSVLSKILGKTGSLASVESADGAILSSYMMGGSGVLGGLAKFGTLMGSGATTAGGVAAAGASSIAGIVGGIAGIGAGIKDLYNASKETNEEIKEQKNWSGGTKIGMVGAGAATGAAIGSVVPGVGTAVGAAVGAGVSGVAAIFKGSDISEWLHSAWDNTLKPFFTETIPENFGKLVDGIGQFFTETIPNTISNIGTGISTFFTETVPEFFGNLIDGVVQFFTEDVPHALGYIAGSLKTFFTETIPNFFKGLWKDIKAFFNETIPTALETIKEKAKTFFTETIPNFFGGIWKSLKKFFTETIPNAVETIKEKAKTFFTETVPNFFKDIWNKLKEFFTETVPKAISKVKTSIKTFFTETIPNKIKSLFGGIGDIFGGAVDWIKSKFSSIGSNFSAGYDAAVNKSSAKSAKSVTATSHAVGGSIAGGQFFVANENGDAELIGNIDGSRKTNVANNNMIIEAMTAGVFEGVYNALAEVNNQRVGTNMGGGNTTIKLDGFGLIDSSTLNELARMLAPYLSSNNKNIADVNFSI